MADYATLAQVKAALRITDQVDDSLLNTAITAASRWVDGYCGREFEVASGTSTRDYVPSGRMEPLMVDDLTSVVSIKIDEDLDRTFVTTLNEIDFQLEPVNALSFGNAYPYTRIRPQEDGYWPTSYNRATVRVEATFGWPEVPDAVRDATILQASRLFTRLESPLGVAGFGDMGAMRVSFRGDPDVLMLLAPYRRAKF
ncbi:MAG TPA: head-tail connector protein [Acidimicrobiia bacterium]